MIGEFIFTLFSAGNWCADCNTFCVIEVSPVVRAVRCLMVLDRKLKQVQISYMKRKQDMNYRRLSLVAARPNVFLQ